MSNRRYKEIDKKEGEYFTNLINVKYVMQRSKFNICKV